MMLYFIFKWTTWKRWLTRLDLNCPLGKNKIGEFLAIAAKVPKRSQTIVRGIGRLLDAEVLESFVVQHSGHKRTESLKHYKIIGVHHQEKISSIPDGQISKFVRYKVHDRPGTMLKQHRYVRP